MLPSSPLQLLLFTTHPSSATQQCALRLPRLLLLFHPYLITAYRRAHCCAQPHSFNAVTATTLLQAKLLLLLTHPSSATQQCTPRRPEYTHRMCWKPKSSRSAVSST
jgi:hypothetical protein